MGAHLFSCQISEGRPLARRITGVVFGCLVVTTLVRYLNIWFYDRTLFWGYLFPPEGYLYNILIAVLYVVIVAGIYEAVYFFREWRTTFEEKEALKREALVTQLESLKDQINPHFMFNNLGSLASLVMENQAKAIEFIHQLSSVYRYVLKSNEHTLVPLAAELDFLQQYFSLLKTRFDEGIALTIDIDQLHRRLLIPPLTLQVLMENVTKHNAILPDQPLRTHLFICDKKLVMINNLQPKFTTIESHQTGLANIIKKYELLQQPRVDIESNDTEFRVAIPLLNAQDYARINS